ncbi:MULTISPECIES: HPP family protein [Kordiimonas]|uniref:HPP family protein n=1 Tax=Kordiimonas TaxID=288021 RepID=UPI002579A601|nr:HPP family protein [Kordiimonas sp. UBA4487]
MKPAGLSKVPPRAPFRHILWSWCGGMLAIGLIALLAKASAFPLMMAPLGASAVLAFGVPDSPLAQPRNIVVGHAVSAFVGLVALSVFGDAWWVAGGAVATAIAAMQLTGTVHPPAGANPLLVIMTGAGWDFLFMPVIAGAALLALVAVGFNRFAARRAYPVYW